jgi:RNA polymerase sigma factor (sigma-70 family)
VDEPDFGKLRDATDKLVAKHRYTRDLARPDRDELVQDVMEAMLRAAGKGETVLNPDAFLEVLVRNRGIDRLRAKKKHDEREVALDGLDGDVLERFVRESKEDRFASVKPVRDHLLAQIFSLVSADAADLLRRRFIEGESSKEAAERLGIKPAAVDQRVRRAKVEVQKVLERNENGELREELKAPHPHVY